MKIIVEDTLLWKALEALDSENPDVQLRAAITLRTALETAEKAETYAWHYRNNGGASVWHMGPSNKLDADLVAAAQFPQAHKIVALYAAPVASVEPLKPAGPEDMAIYQAIADSYAHPIVASEEAKDAARYRWLKARAYKDGATLSCEVAVIDDIAIGDFSEFIDAAIDAAMGEK